MPAEIRKLSRLPAYLHQLLIDSAVEEIQGRNLGLQKSIAEEKRNL
jgi:hypothetical protein